MTTRSSLHSRRKAPALGPLELEELLPWRMVLTLRGGQVAAQLRPELRRSCHSTYEYRTSAYYDSSVQGQFSAR